MPSPATSVPEFVDPYTYPGTSVLRNLLDIRDAEELLEAELEVTWARRQQLGEGAVALAAHGGRELAWRNVSEAENIAASAASVRDPQSLDLRILLEQVILPPHDGLSVLDGGIYVVGPPTELSPDAAGDDGLERLQKFQR